MNNNLLNDKIIPISRDDEEIIYVNLAELMSYLGSEDSVTLCNIKPYQRPAFHQFTVQLSVCALDKAGSNILNNSADQWRDMILSIAPEHAFDLYSNNPEQAAFMQPPMDLTTYNEAKLNVEKHRNSPDELTVLMTAKNHSTKFSTVSSGTTWDWICSLIEFQTLSKQGGNGHYCGVRMSGGFGTRLMAGVYDSLDAGSMWRRDVSVLIKNLNKIRDTHESFSKSSSAKTCLWLYPWDGNEQINMSELNPMFIDVARRIRLFESDGNIKVLYSTSKTTRVNARHLNGDIGDPWLPIKIDENKRSAVDYQRLDLAKLASILFPMKAGDNIEKPLLMKESYPDAKNPFIYLAGFNGGKKITDFYEFVIPAPLGMVIRNLNDEIHEEIAQNASAMLKDIDVANRALKSALLSAWFCGKPLNEIGKKQKDTCNLPQLAIETLDKELTQYFLQYAFKYGTALDLETGEVNIDKALLLKCEWRSYLINKVRDIFEILRINYCKKNSLSYKSDVISEKILNGILAKIQPKLP